jgi:hypothetical protein
MAAVADGFADEGDHLVIPVAGAAIEQVCVDYAVTYHLSAANGLWELRLESGFVVTSNGAERLVVPETGANVPAALDVLRAEVVEAVAYKDGALRMSCADGLEVAAPPDEGYEAWTLTGPRGARLVSLPGGEVAVWSPDPPPS